MALSMRSERVRIQAGEAQLEGMLWLPEDQIQIILFAHSGSANRVKPPNDYVASVLREARLGTLWLDLLMPGESGSRRICADIELLTKRLEAACDWLREYAATRHLPIGLFGASNCATAVLRLAAARSRGISAVVARGGLPDTENHSALARINAPTLLIAGGLDDGAVAKNRAAYAALRCKKRFEIIPGATRSFEEPGNLEVVARLARAWFLRHSQPAHV
jgi:putative phosphoribosyl transferase